jgi:predicted TIM-barrel fold metal-dependent hydrolase
MHFGTSGQIPTTGPDAPVLVSYVIIGGNSMAAMADLLFSPVFHRFDRLKVALSEGGLGWIPYMIERADYVWEGHRNYAGVHDVRPSDLYRKHIWGCFISDVTGIRDRDAVGVDRMLWESDYPHGDSLWPHAREKAAELLSAVPDQDVHRIVELNAREVFNFDADRADKSA